MILFHGTPESRGVKIIEEGIISNKAKRIYDQTHEDMLKECIVSCSGVAPTSLASTIGYVYLTNSLFYAMYYGNKNAVLNEENYFYVFKTDIEEENLEADLDEVRMVLMDDPKKYTSAIDTLKACKSARYGHQIEQFQYCKFPTTTNFEDELSNTVLEVVREFNNEFNHSNPYMEQYIAELKVTLDKICKWT